MQVIYVLCLVFVAACSKAAPAATAPLAVEPAIPAAAPTASPPPPESLRAPAARPGEEAVTPTLAATLDELQPTARFAWIAERGRCDRVAILAAASVRLVVRDGHGRSLVQEAGEREVEARHCSQGGGTSLAEVTGAGLVSLRVFAGDKIAVAPGPAKVHTPAAPVEQDELARRIASQAQAAAPGARKVGAIFRAGAAQQKTDWTQHLDAGRCYTFVGAGADGLKQLGLYLWNPAGDKVTYQRSSGPNAVMYFCTKVAGPYRFQAKQNFGKGDYAVGVYVKG